MLRTQRAAASPSAEERGGAGRPLSFPSRVDLGLRQQRLFDVRRGSFLLPTWAHGDRPGTVGMKEGRVNIAKYGLSFPVSALCHLSLCFCF